MVLAQWVALALANNNTIYMEELEVFVIGIVIKIELLGNLVSIDLQGIY